MVLPITIAELQTAGALIGLVSSAIGLGSALLSKKS